MKLLRNFSDCVKRLFSIRFTFVFVHILPNFQFLSMQAAHFQHLLENGRVC